MNWKDKEKGPECFCGMPTFVHVDKDGRADLVCMFHSRDAGAMFPLPKNGRPDNWPNLSIKEVDDVMMQGQAEEERREQN